MKMDLQSRIVGVSVSLELCFQETQGLGGLQGSDLV